MSDLQNQTPADTYKGLLQVGDYTNGVDGNSEYIEDGEGTPSALSISTTKVGVGTVSPSAELDVNGGIEATTLTTSGAVTGGSVSTSGAVTAGSLDVSGNVVADEYALDQTGTSTSAVAIHAPATNELAIRTNSAERVRVDSDGNVGIGNTDCDVFQGLFSSASNLSIGGAKPAEIELGFNATAYSNFLTGTGGVAFLNNSNTSTTFNSANSKFVGGIYCDTKSDTISSNPNANAGGILRFLTKEINNAPTEAMRIDTSGNVGINTTTPTAPLEVSSTTGGVIMPRMTTTQRDAISSPTDGEMIYNTTTNTFQGRANGAWVDFH